MAAYVLLEPTPSTDAGAAYCTGIGELATTVVMAASYSGPDEVEREGQIDCRSVAGCFRSSPLHCASREGRGGGYYRLGQPGQLGQLGQETAAGGESQKVAEIRRESMRANAQERVRKQETAASKAVVRGYKGKNGRHGRSAAKEAGRMETRGASSSSGSGFRWLALVLHA